MELVKNPLFARYQRAADLIWPHLMGGCRVQRQIQEAIAQAFSVEACRGFRFPPFAAFSQLARVLGVARNGRESFRGKLCIVAE